MYLYFDKKEKEFRNEKDEFIFCSETGEQLLFLKDVANVNVFIGANNSGKSKFLRGLIKADHIKFSTVENKKVEESIDCVKKLFDIFLNVSYIEIVFLNAEFELTSLKLSKSSGNYILNKVDFESIVSYLEKFLWFLESGIWQVMNSDIEKITILKVIEKILQPSDDLYSQLAAKVRGRASIVRFFAPYKDTLIKLNKNLEEIRSVNQKREEEKRVFIPILRSLYDIYPHKTGGVREIVDLYENVIEDNYQINKVKVEGGYTHRNRAYIHTGLSLYDNIVRARNGYSRERKKFEHFVQFIQKHFFPKAELDIVAHINEHNERRIIIKLNSSEDDRPIYELGDGIQSIVNLTFPLFMAENNTLVFIEEPEIHLHPGLQRMFLEMILSNDYLVDKNIKYFITTHSNHLIDIAAEEKNVSIYTFNKVEVGKHVIQKVERNNIEVLNLLGVRNSSVLMSQCTIWVEGVTDRIYIDKYLHEYIKELKCEKLIEDYDYAFFEYSGANVSHYIFGEEVSEADIAKIKAQFLSNRILLIADSDANREAKHELLEGWSSGESNFSYIKLPVMEIENLLNPSYLLKVLKENNCNIKENTSIWEKVKYDEKYKSNKVKKYFKSKGVVLPEAIFAKSGTLESRYKLKVAHHAKDNITWADMTDEAKELAKQVYDFIVAAKGKQ